MKEQKSLHDFSLPLQGLPLKLLKLAQKYKNNRYSIASADVLSRSLVHTV
ncbi:MAG: hypothetical protein WAZ77_18325 [Candidatus Nitrosopolaris sp.]